jgi:hypothetical protein
VHTVRPNQHVLNRLLSEHRRLRRIVATEAIPLHSIDPQKSLFRNQASRGRFLIQNSSLCAENMGGKYAQMSQTESLQSEPLAGTEAPLAKALANRLSQRPASCPPASPGTALT